MDVPPKFEKYMKLLDIFGDTISKCPDIIRKNTPLLAHSLDSSSSIELKLLFSHYESPCTIYRLWGGPLMMNRSSELWKNWKVFRYVLTLKAGIQLCILRGLFVKRAMCYLDGLS